MGGRCDELHLFFAVFHQRLQHTGDKILKKEKKQGQADQVSQKKEPALPDNSALNLRQRMPDEDAELSGFSWDDSSTCVGGRLRLLRDGKFCMTGESAAALPGCRVDVVLLCSDVCDLSEETVRVCATVLVHAGKALKKEWLPIVKNTDRDLIIMLHLTNPFM